MMPIKDILSGVLPPVLEHLKKIGGFFIACLVAYKKGQADAEDVMKDKTIAAQDRIIEEMQDDKDFGDRIDFDSAYADRVRNALNQRD